MTILTSRRRFLAGLFCAPSVIPAARLMAVRAWVEPAPDLFALMKERMRATEIARMVNVNPPIGFDAAGNAYELFTSYFRWAGGAEFSIARDRENTKG